MEMKMKRAEMKLERGSLCGWWAEFFCFGRATPNTTAVMIAGLARQCLERPVHRCHEPTTEQTPTGLFRGLRQGKTYLDGLSLG